MLTQQFVRGFTNSNINQYTKDYTGQSNANAITPFNQMDGSAAGTTNVKVYGRNTQGTSNNHWYISLGRGDTEPAYTDSQLADLITELTYVGGSGLCNISAGIIRSVNSSFFNGTSSPITVKEIGLGFHSSTGGSGLLMARSVLETPITIGVGETYAFTYNIEVA